MKNWPFWCVVVPLPLAGTLLRDRAKRVCLERRMAGRPPLTASEFGRHFFPADRAEVAAQAERLMTVRDLTDAVAQARGQGAGAT